ncbi:MAG: glucose-6-phosphate isomerase [Pseudonocardiales bacterium]|nr:glucose-6-phosphate isomerase [Actinomycetota bacterium]PZS14973.1 MAG: glucose-6-phosphate isomerase [Pseudonocardiales bacterium]
MRPLTVEISSPTAAADSLVDNLVGERVASALTKQDPTLWGPQAQDEAARRLAWVALPHTSRPLLATIDALWSELHADGIDRVVLAGMGGSSLAPEVICATSRVPLTVLDTTDPGQVADALAGDLERTVLVVSSKSGSTVETDSHRRVFAAAFAAAGLDPAAHLVVVTDPGSPLQRIAEEQGYRAVITAEPNVGGRYSALTAFGLVPAGLARADIANLLDDAEHQAPSLAADDPTNPALRLAAALAVGHAAGAEKVVLTDTGSGIVGFADWAEQLIAESTGKNGTGLLPVVVGSPAAPGFADAGPDATPVAIGPDVAAASVAVSGTLGGQLLLWEYAIAVVGRVLGINPFDQPDVEAAKVAARAQLDALNKPAARPAPAFVEGDVAVYPVGNWMPAGIATLSDALRALITATPARGYLAVQAYLDRIADASATVLRAELARRAQLQTTFGWGPRFLHSTGQYHKGGHQNGAFLQLTGAVTADIPVPGTQFTLGDLQQAQALGDADVLAGHGRPVLRVHLLDRAAGLVALAHAMQEL